MNVRINMGELEEIVKCGEKGIFFQVALGKRVDGCGKKQGR